jgi:hypothetical protein
MTTTKPQNDLNLPLELSSANAIKHGKWWHISLGLVAIVLIIEAAWLSQNYWLAKTTVRQVINPILAPMGYTLRRPVLVNTWQINRLALKANPYDHRLWQGQAVIAHHADILQPWPTLELTLRDWQGRIIARGLLQPDQYLPATLPARYAADRLIAYNEPVLIEFAIRLPTQTDELPAAVEQVELRAVKS